MARKSPQFSVRHDGSVMVNGIYASYSIGRIVETSVGFYVHVFPVLGTAHGPLNTRTAAILRVIRNYAAWIGVPPSEIARG